ncbi:hypothetical protein QBC34DRAFT_383071 [Podospora aff. communis PSN243]|uniref:Uncharacterized protein n=1 Tax=Podospora aff. communis PSN243 TaxID=3040156 RepID=A0AAV9GCZ6_9PEZI|nr:hypothetical protein QBC34DRAFT_383071 [Podospora aff. communis PSN243]
MAAPAPEFNTDIQARNFNATARAAMAYDAEIAFWDDHNNGVCGGNNWRSEGRPDGVCYPVNSGSLMIRMLNRGRGCRFVRVFSGTQCNGDSADLGGENVCWTVRTRRSYQIYC